MSDDDWWLLVLTSYVLSGVVEVMNCVIVVTFFFGCKFIYEFYRKVIDLQNCL